MLIVVSLLFARFLGWAWMDPVAGLNERWLSVAGLTVSVRDTGAVLLDMNPDQGMAERMRAAIETDEE